MAEYRIEVRRKRDHLPTNEITTFKASGYWIENNCFFAIHGPRRERTIIPLHNIEEIEVEKVSE